MHVRNSVVLWKQTVWTSVFYLFSPSLNFVPKLLTQYQMVSRICQFFQSPRCPWKLRLGWQCTVATHPIQFQLALIPINEVNLINQHLLVGGWTNPFEKYARQNGFIFPNASGLKIFENPPRRFAKAKRRCVLRSSCQALHLKWMEKRRLFGPDYDCMIL